MEEWKKPSQQTQKIARTTQAGTASLSLIIYLGLREGSRPEKALFTGVE